MPNHEPLRLNEHYPTIVAFTSRKSTSPVREVTVDLDQHITKSHYLFCRYKPCMRRVTTTINGVLMPFTGFRLNHEQVL